MSTHPPRSMRLHTLAIALSLALTALPSNAQTSSAPATDPHAGHTMPAPAVDPKKKKPAAATPIPAKKKPAAADPHAGHTMTTPAPAPAKKKPAPVDPHAGHTMAAPAPAAAKKKPAPVSPVPAKKRPAPVDPHAGHTMATPAPAPARKKPTPAAADPHAGHTMTAPAPAAPAKKKPSATAADPHAGHTKPAPVPATPAKTTPAPTAVDPHAGHAMPAQTPAAVEPDPHAGHVMPAETEAPSAMDHAAMGHEMPLPDNAPRTLIPVPTDADRAAAFPPLQGHAAHDKRTHSYWLLDRLEAWDADEGTAVGWDATAWIGGDIHRVWLRSEGETIDGDIESADVEVLGGRTIARWWDVVAGVRHDFGEGPSQTFAAIGVMGVAPGKYEVEATAYLGTSGQTALEIEAEYDTLLTNRLILQWRGEAGFFGKDDPERGVGSGLSTMEVGARLRYEVNRRFAPYVGVEYERAFGGTADFRPVDHDTRVVVGVRIWF